MGRKKFEIPLYIIDGFLESGKTSFIIDTVTADYFQYDGKTLILSCEQGEVEYDEELFKKYDTIIEYITKEQIKDKEYLNILLLQSRLSHLHNNELLSKSFEEHPL